jgi:hypothetical protein
VQAPYEAISEARYRELATSIRPLRGELEHEDELEARFCDGEACELPGTT